LSGRTIDHLWIIGNHPLAGSPRQTLDLLPHVAYTTFENFQSSLINFQPVLAHNISTFEQDDSFGSFIETRVHKSETPLLSAVDDWLQTDKTALVVYGGYGLGKTTFSKYLACTLSQRFLDNGCGRIPIRFSLSDIYYKQDLISLISASLAGGESGVAVKNFSYSLFLEMNKLGNFVLIFDGFDEMRHAIELEDFVFNFEQMRSLMVGSAKVIILGRPDAFLSTGEELKVLSSLFNNPQQTKDKLALLEVSFFNDDDVRQYLAHFMDARNFDASKRAQVQSLLRLMPADDEENILSRPVQLKMFTQVLDDFIDAGLLPTRFKLYESFIYRFIIREKTKLARGLRDSSDSSAKDARARFMQNIAWWILVTKKENRFVPSEISRSLIPDEIAKRHGDEAAVREALLGSVVEPMDHSGILGKKTNRFYYFPHKSYIEFLVAQYFSYAQFTIDRYRDFIQNVTPEIASFVEEGPHSGFENLKSGLDYATSKIPKFLIDVAARAPSTANDIKERNVDKSTTPVRIYLYYLHLRQISGNVADFLQRQMANTSVANRVLAVINCTADYLDTTGDQRVARFLVLNFLTSVFDDHKLLSYVRDKEPAEILRDGAVAVKAGALLSAVKLGSSGISLYPGRLSHFAEIVSKATPYVDLSAHDESREIFLPRNYLISENEALDDHSAAVINGLLNATGIKKPVNVPITLRGDALRYST
jgi:hypothetical protein